MAITNENHIIDVEEIKRGCQIINEAAKDYTTCAKYIREAGDICSPSALAVEKTSMQPTIYDLADAVDTIEANINTFTQEIINAANEIYYTQWNELQEYNRKKQEAEAAAAAQASGSTYS